MRATLKKRVEQIEDSIPKSHAANERVPRDVVWKLHRAYCEPGTVPTETDYAVTWGDVEHAIKRAYG